MSTDTWTLVGLSARRQLVLVPIAQVVPVTEHDPPEPMSREVAVRPLGLDGHDEKLPRTNATHRRHTTARQQLKRLQLEWTRVRRRMVNGWCCHCP